ncbi:Peroxiredoxin-5, mitochondrial [Apophysomyces sp. BC1034]|nr:Peroxiredoxin-5, mitochondrial [Apophysomyces sp. BC1015]KAG0183442.1 Peroxiredoxin-5, mitochondrial [Apophysomyces sp. BC1021]KAG0193808.1 Peroxiredoxin-5, mitochondrial [Apophysomyces sp. BC1034]
MLRSVSLLGRRSFHTSPFRAIQVGDRIPSVKVHRQSPGDVVDTNELFSQAKKAIFIGVPGAFTPGCSKTHLPGYIKQVGALKDKGVDLIACVSVNDAFVMSAWGVDLKTTQDDITLLADSKGELAKAMDLSFDASGALGNHRFKRFAAIVENGVVKHLFVEPDKTGLDVSLVQNVEKYL